jgi:hypothetical protein
MKTKRYTPYLVLFAALILLAGCGQLVVGIETPVAQAGQPTEIAQPTRPVTATEPTTPEPAPTSQPSPYWTVVEDPQYGVRYALPCFWQVNFPPDYGPGTGAQSYAITNYPYDFVQTFPRGQGIFEAGGIKIDMNFMNVADWGITPGASLTEFVQTLYPAGGETQVTGMEELTINNQPALRVATESNFGPGGFTLLAVTDTIYLLFAPIPEAAKNPDVLAILNSIAISETTAVQMPTLQPGPPPTGLSASCLEDPSQPNTFSETPTEMDCQAVTPDSPDWTPCNVQLGITSRNLSALLGYMTNPFHIGYWGSEGRTDTPEAIIEELRSSRLPSDPSLAPTFTTNRDLFPPLGGQSPESLFGPDVTPVQVVYSEGWGPNRDGAALLYFIENQAGEVEWYGLIYSDAKFDK